MDRHVTELGLSSASTSGATAVVIGAIESKDASHAIQNDNTLISQITQHPSAPVTFSDGKTHSGADALNAAQSLLHHHKEAHAWAEGAIWIGLGTIALSAIALAAHFAHLGVRNSLRRSLGR